MADPLGKDVAARRYRLDAFGRLEPVPERFPSAARGGGSKALADWTHQQGLRFGIHIVRGVPKRPVAANMPIAGSTFHAAEAADKAAPCPWDQGNEGIADNAAGQAYYDALVREYAAWGGDFLKVDCIADHPYRPTEIQQISLAIRRAGRPMVLSLSPGPANPGHIDEMAASAQMWRSSDDFWDGWTFRIPIPRAASRRVCSINLIGSPGGAYLRGRTAGRTQTCCPSASYRHIPDGATRGRHGCLPRKHGPPSCFGRSPVHR